MEQNNGCGYALISTVARSMASPVNTCDDDLCITLRMTSDGEDDGACRVSECSLVLCSQQSACANRWSGRRRQGGCLLVALIYTLRHVVWGRRLVGVYKQRSAKVAVHVTAYVFVVAVSVSFRFAAPQRLVRNGRVIYILYAVARVAARAVVTASTAAAACSVA